MVWEKVKMQKFRKQGENNLELEKLLQILKNLLLMFWMLFSSQINSVLKTNLFFVEHSFSKFILTTYFAWILDRLKDNFTFSTPVSWTLFKKHCVKQSEKRAMLILPGKP